MRMTMTLLALSFSIFIAGCGAKSSTADDSSGTTPGGGGGSGPFTAAQVSKAWVSDCTASDDAMLGTHYYINHLTLNSDNTFQLTQYLHDGTLGSNCNNANYTVVTTIYGVYSIGSLVSGTTYGIAFTVITNSPGFKDPDMMITGSTQSASNTIETAWNGDCGGTSPYCTLGGMPATCSLHSVASGAHSATKSMLCMNSAHVFPSASNNTVYNVGTYDGTTLTLGAGSFGIPGVFSAGSTPTTATVAYH